MSEYIEVSSFTAVCFGLLTKAMNPNTTQKAKFSIKNFFSKCDQIRWKVRIWSHLLKKSLMENFIFCTVKYENYEDFRVPLTRKSKKTACVHFLLCAYNMHPQKLDKRSNFSYAPPPARTIEIEAIFVTNFLLNK